MIVKKPSCNIWPYEIPFVLDQGDIHFDTGQQYGNLGRRSLSFKAGNINLKCGNSECDKFLIKGLANKFQFTDYYVQCIYCRKWNYLPEPLESDLPI